MTNGAGTGLGWGILSTARIASEVMPGLQRSDRNHLVAVASRSIESAAAFAVQHGVARAHGSYEDLLADPDIDVVYVCLPNALHAEWVERSLLAGKHVLCEKPLTPTPVEAERLFGLASERGLRLAEAFMYRHHPKTLALRALVRSGRLGQVHTIRSHFGFMAADPDGDIRFRPEMAGGALYDVGVYCVNLSNFLLDASPTHVSGSAVLHPSGVDERFYGTLHYDGEVVATFDCGMLSALHFGVSVLGTAGEAVVPMPWYAHGDPPTIELRTPAAGLEILECAGKNSYFLETEDFARSVLEGSDPALPTWETVRTLDTVCRLRAAAGLTV